MTDKNISDKRRNLLKGLAGANALPFIGALGALQARAARCRWPGSRACPMPTWPRCRWTSSMNWNG
jgi:hypothetical protein